jgi:hypothetical protein
VQFLNGSHPFGNNFSFIITGLKRDLKITICSDHDEMNDLEGGSTVTFKESPLHVLHALHGFKKTIVYTEIMVFENHEDRYGGSG